MTENQFRSHFPIDARNHKVLVIWDLNGYGEYEFDWCELLAMEPHRDDVLS